jgi:hypothetical protein
MPILEEIWKEVAADFRKFRNKESNNLYASQNIFHGMENVNTANKQPWTTDEWRNCGFFLVQILTKQLCSLKTSVSIK